MYGMMTNVMLQLVLLLENVGIEIGTNSLIVDA
jgi:hypothetical protein